MPSQLGGKPASGCPPAWTERAHAARRPVRYRDLGTIHRNPAPRSPASLQGGKATPKAMPHS
eukprot:2193044-Pyramimonas_sp.AAC.1